MPQDFGIDGGDAPHQKFDGGAKFEENSQNIECFRGQKKFAAPTVQQKNPLPLFLLFIAVLTNNFSRKHEKIFLALHNKIFVFKDIFKIQISRKITKIFLDSAFAPKILSLQPPIFGLTDLLVGSH